MANSEPNATTASPPSAAEVRAELARVLGSTVFAQAGRSTEFLRFVVEETLQGLGDRLKGYAIGAARVSEKHANFIVNPEGAAKAADIEAIIAHVRAVVRERTGVDLEPEVQVIGESA